MRCVALVLAVCVLGACGTGAASHDAGTDAGTDAGSPTPSLHAGVASADITPAPGIEIVGFGTRVSTEVRDPLLAHVLVLRTGDARVALVTFDLPGIFDWYAEQLRARIASAIGVDFASVIVAASHTHSAPMFADDAWTRASMDDIASAAREAAASLEPVDAFWGEGAIAFDVNRRLVVDGVAEARPNPEGAHDPRVRTLVLRGARGPVALLSHFVCHPNTLLGVESTRISADFPGDARAILVAEYDAPWLFVIGAAGDVRPDVAFRDGAFQLGDDEDLADLGAQLAQAVRDGAGEASAIDVNLAAARETWHAPTRDGATRILDLSAWRLGPIVWVTMPGEPMVEVGLEAERRMREGGATHALVIGYANGYASYFVTPEDEPFGGYEVGRASLTAEGTSELEVRVAALAATLF